MTLLGKEVLGGYAGFVFVVFRADPQPGSKSLFINYTLDGSFPACNSAMGIKPDAFPLWSTTEVQIMYIFISTEVCFIVHFVDSVEVTVEQIKQAKCHQFSVELCHLNQRC